MITAPPRLCRPLHASPMKQDVGTVVRSVFLDGKTLVSLVLLRYTVLSAIARMVLSQALNCKAVLCP